MTMTADVLETELATFEAHRQELLGAASGKYALVHGTEVIGTYDTEQDAVEEGYRRLGNVPFLVKHITAADLPETYVSNLLAI